MTLKLDAVRVIESTAALAPDTLSETPFTLMTVSVVSVTLEASANVGASNATRIPAPVSIRGIVSFN